MKIRLLASSDIHGVVMPYQYSNNKPCDHGFLKLEAKMNEVQTPYTLRIDNGDLLEGSPLLTYHYKNESTKPNPFIKLMNDAKYDYINLGNHDFNYGQENLFAYLNNINAKCLTGNILYKGKAIGNKYTIHQFDKDNAIAIIGVVTHYIKNWEKRENLEDITVLNAFDFTKDTIREIKENEKVKGIVVVYHGGFEKDIINGGITESLTGENEAYRMCEEIDGIDVLISGHQHRTIASKLFNTSITQTAYNASEIAMIDWDLDTNVREEKILKADIKEELASKEIIELEKKVQIWLDEEVGEVIDVDLRVNNEFDARLIKHPVISFINKVQLEASKADLSGNALFNGAVGFNRIITMRDIVSTYVYPNTIVVYEINGKILKEYLEKSAEYFDIEDDKIVVSREFIYPKPQHYNYDMVDGIEYTIKVSNQIGSRIISLKYQGIDVKDVDIFTLALSNYRASGGGNYFMFENCKVVKEIQKDMVTLISEYLFKYKKVRVNHHDNIKVIK